MARKTTVHMHDSGRARHSHPGKGIGRKASPPAGTRFPDAAWHRHMAKRRS